MGKTEISQLAQLSGVVAGLQKIVEDLTTVNEGLERRVSSLETEVAQLKRGFTLVDDE